MPVCSFFLQGRCRYGDKCWNEHPRGGNRGGGGGGGGHNNYNRSSGQQQQQPRGGGGGGFGNRVWVNPNQQKGGYIQPSSFSHGNDDWTRGGGGNDWGRGDRGGGGGGGSDWGRGDRGGGGSDWGRGDRGGGSDWGRGDRSGGSDWGRGDRGGGGSDWGRGDGGGGSDWGRGGGGRRDNVSFSTQNRFSTLDAPTTFDRGARQGQVTAAGDEDDDKKLEIIQADMEIWESSKQWVLSCYSTSKASLSGFTDVSPEELRLEYYSSSASGDQQNHIIWVNQLVNQWRSRVQELKVMNSATRDALLAELNNPAPQASSGGFGLAAATGFGSPTSGFGSKGFGAPAPVQASSYNFAASGSGFGSSAAPSAPTSFGSALAAPVLPPSGFGSSSAVTSAPSASTFSFAGHTSDKPAAAPGFGSASGFSFSSTANTGGGFGSGFGTETPATASGGFGATSTPAAAAGDGSVSGAPGSLFSIESTLTPEELNQFKAKRFTLGQIPLKPPPADLLVV